MAVIAGVLRMDSGLAAASDLRNILGKLAHRAPDGVAIYDDGGFALGHGALRVSPGVFDSQPIAVGDRWTIVVDGRIDNSASLAHALGLDAADLPRIGNSGLFALAWRQWGLDLWRHVEGDFALAAWDSSAHRLVLLRDRIGVRPLFFARSSHLLAFASEPEALLGLDGISRSCDPDGLAYLLADDFEFDDQEKTLYRDVRRLQPGCQLEAFADGQVRIERFWQTGMQPATPRREQRDWIDAFTRTFDESVQCRLHGVTSPALLLSGGIDSGCILAAARRMRSSGAALPLRLISLIETVEPVSGETANIRRLHEATDGLLIPVDTPEFSAYFTELWKLLWDESHPIDNSLSYAMLGCMVARDAGCKVVMDGADGDVVTMAADCRAGTLAASGHVIHAWREARLASRVNTYLRGVSPARILLGGLAAAVQPDWLAAWRYRRRYFREDDAVPGLWMDAGFAKRLQLRERRYFAALESRRRNSGSTRQERLAWKWWNPGFQRAMEGTDRAYARFGLEARHPWCDQRIVELFQQMPEELLARDGWTKWVVRAACAPELGDNIAWNSDKSHLGSVLGPLSLEASRERVSELLERSQDVLAGVANSDAVARLRKAWQEDPARAIGSHCDDISNIATMAGWIDRYQLRLC